MGDLANMLVTVRHGNEACGYGFRVGKPGRVLAILPVDVTGEMELVSPLSKVEECRIVRRDAATGLAVLDATGGERFPAAGGGTEPLPHPALVLWLGPESFRERRGELVEAGPGRARISGPGGAPAIGAPVFGADVCVGIVVGVETVKAEGSGPESTPDTTVHVALFSGLPPDFTSLLGISARRLRQPPFRGWVRVTGGFQPSDADRLRARAVGELLAVRGFGLVHGGSQGVDAEAQEGFLAAGGSGARVRFYGRTQWTRAVEPPEGATVAGFEGDQVREGFFGRVVVALNGAAGTEKLVAEARAGGTPILPVPCGDGTAVQLFNLQLNSWPTAQVDVFAMLSERSIRRQMDALSLLLDALLPPSKDADPARPDRAWIEPDAATGFDDRLKVKDDAERLAQLILDEGTHPPLAIAVLGAWGSGKSFLMDLIFKAISERVAADPNLPRICQINFNAWHYADATLWASVAAHIFDGLAVADGLGPDDLLRALANARQTQERLEKARSKAAADVIAAQAEVDRLRSRAEEQRAFVRANRSTGSLLADPAMLAALEKSDQWKALAPQLEALSKRLGVADAQEALRVVLGAGSAGVSSLRTASATLMEMRTRLLPRTAAGWLVAAGLLGLGVVATILPAFEAWAGATVKEAVQALMPTLLLVVRLLAAFKGSAQELATTAQEAQALLGNAQSAVDAVIDADPRVASVVDEVSVAEKTLETARQKATNLVKEADKNTAELKRLDPEKQRADLILARSAEDGPYQKAEGLVSRLRRDLKRLDELDRLDTKKRRIVLYIDDLDRCPTDQVVKVLQALQLLLASNLFIVIVAVDPRWLERSLEAEHSQQFGGRAGAIHGRVDPVDYLEKIFQLPFVLAPVGKDGFANLTNSLFGQGEDKMETKPAPEDGKPDGGKPDEGKPTSDEPKPDQDNPAPDPATPGLHENAQPKPDQDNPATPGLNENAQLKLASLPVLTANQEARKIAANAEAAVKARRELAERFRLSAAEHARIADFHPLIGTPRSAKRFVNIYRMLRASTPDFESFIAHDYPVVQLLCAASIGHPRLGGELLRALHAGATWDDALTRIEQGNADELEARRRFRRHLEELAPRGSEAPRPTAWKEWAPQVGRYTFFWSWEP